MDEHTQIPTIKKAVTYIVDKDGNEVEQNPEVGIQETESRLPRDDS